MCILIKALRVKPENKTTKVACDQAFVAEPMRYAKTLSEMIQIETISTEDNLYLDNMRKFHEYVLKTFPNIANTCTLQDFNGGMMIRWQGESAASPIVLMSHLDVVPAKGDWAKPPFSGDIDDKTIWGRGAVDTKGALCAELYSMETLIAEGFVPKQDVYILSSSREEIGGEDMLEMVKYLSDKNIVPAIVLDEGGAIMDAPLGGVKGQFAMIAMCERAAKKVLIRARQGKGKAPATRLANFMLEINKTKLSPRKFSKEVYAMFSTLAPYAVFPMKILLANLNVFEKLLCAVIPKISPEGTAMIGTTCSFGTPKDKEIENFVYGDVSMTATLMGSPYHDLEASYKIFDEVAKKYDLETVILSDRSTPQPEPMNSTGYNYTKEVVEKVFNDVVVSPFVLFGGTDARHWIGKADSVLRFAPLYINAKQFKTFHHEDEHIDIDSISNAVKFYREFVKGFAI